MTLKLTRPITRGEEKIETVWLTRPSAGELRGLKLLDLIQMDVTAVSTVLPRISNPSLLPAEVAELDPADLMALSLEISGFFVRSEDLAAAKALLQ